MTNPDIRIKDLNWETIKQTIGIDCYGATFAALINHKHKIGVKSRAQIINLCEKVFVDPALRANEAARVGATKMLVALLPASLPVLKRWLKRKTPNSSYDVHFSIFCYLDQVQHFEELKSLKSSILSLVTEYLKKSRVDRAEAVWMAADLLADHWNLRDSLPFLLDAAQNASASFARVVAVRALGEAVDKCLDEEHMRIQNTLERLLKDDSSRSVRVAAGNVMQNRIGNINAKRGRRAGN